VPFKRKIQVIKNVQEISIKFQFVMILLNLHKEIFIYKEERNTKYIKIQLKLISFLLK